MGSLFEIVGLISGIDTNSLIDGILSVQQRPILALQDQKAEIDRKAKATAVIGTAVSDLEAMLTSLKLASNTNAKSVLLTQSTTSLGRLTATASASAANGTHVVTVKTLATATRVESGAAIGQAVNSAVSITDPPTGSGGSGLSAAATAGTFTIYGPSGNATITITDGDTLTTVIANINGQTGTTGVSAALVSNKLELTVGAGTISVGAGGDTSNFLDVANLSGANQSGLTLTSTHNIGVVQTSADLQDARFSTALSASTATFEINGVSIAYDETADSLNEMISRINASTAGVVAAYDSVQDKLVLTAKSTGAETIGLQDTAGNFLAATGVLSATQTLGQNAVFTVDTVDGGNDITRAGNTITDVIPGVTLTLEQADAANAITVTIQQDTGASTSLVQNFVAKVNSLLDLIADQTAFDADDKTAAVLLGDSAISGLAVQIRNIVLGQAEGLTGEFTSLQDVGVTTGVVGTKAGSANTVQVDLSDLIDKLIENPDAVADLFTKRETAAVLKAGGIGNIGSLTGAPTVRREAGTYKLEIATIVGDPAVDPQAATLTFTPDDGGTAIVQTFTVTPGEANTAVIPGMTINMAATLAAGSDEITVTVPVRGIAHILDDYLEGVLGPNGVFEAREDSAASQKDDLDDRILKQERRLFATRDRLVRQFAALEATLARLQGQQNFINSQLSTLGGFGIGRSG